MAEREEMGGQPASGQLSRRALLRRAGRGAVVGVAAWVVPEIVVASPAGAQPLSAPPTGGGGGSPPGSGPGGSPPPGSQGATGGPGATAPAGAVTEAAGPQTGAGGALAFTGTDAEALLGAGVTLVAGGWAIHRWASRREPSAEPEPPAG